MSMYGYDLSLYDYGYSDQAVTNSLYGHSLPPMGAWVDYDDEIYARRRPPPRSKLSGEPTVSSPPKHRHDGTSPLPLGMDWSLPPRVWEGRYSVWPFDSQKGWSYCLTLPSWTTITSASGSDAVFFNVQVGIQSPEGITTTRGVQRRFNEFLNLYSELKKEFPKKNLPPPPPRRLMKMRSKKLLEERMCALEGWMQNLLSDIDVSRTAHVAIFLELEAAARQACIELNQNESAAVSVPSRQSPSNPNSGLRSSLGDDSLEPGAEVLQDDSAVALSSEEETVSTERERSTGMQWDMEELQRKCTQLELRLTSEQDARTYAESMKTTTLEQNEMLLKELDDAKEQIENLMKQQNEVELKSKSDIELLRKEIQSLQTSHSELKQELNKCLEEKAELENKNKNLEAENATKAALLYECELLRNRLQECSVNFLDEEDNVMVDTSSTDAIDLLETSDSQIGLLLEEARILTETAANQEDNNGIPVNRGDGLRTLLGDLLTVNLKLRKQVNFLIRHTLSKHGNSLKDDDGMQGGC